VLPASWRPVNDVAVTVELVSVVEKSNTFDTFIKYDVALAAAVQLNVGIVVMLVEPFGGYCNVTGFSGTAVVKLQVDDQLLNVDELFAWTRQKYVALPASTACENVVAVVVTFVIVVEKSFTVEIMIVYDVALAAEFHTKVGTVDMLVELFAGAVNVTGLSGTAVVKLNVDDQFA
jgi:hypothetical protein